MSPVAPVPNVPWDGRAGIGLARRTRCTPFFLGGMRGMRGWPGTDDEATRPCAVSERSIDRLYISDGPRMVAAAREGRGAARRVAEVLTLVCIAW
jgi:hypothetical protein